MTPTTRRCNNPTGQPARRRRPTRPHAPRRNGANPPRRGTPNTTTRPRWHARTLSPGAAPGRAP
eukprot:9055112-Lingulodinium_polyedra.AAC.1